MNLSKKFAVLVRVARTERKLTQQEVADAVSISARWFQRIEKGDRLPSALIMLRLILFLDLDIGSLREDVGLVVSLYYN